MNIKPHAESVPVSNQWHAILEHELGNKSNVIRRKDHLLFKEKAVKMTFHRTSILLSLRKNEDEKKTDEPD